MTEPRMGRLNASHDLDKRREKKSETLARLERGGTMQSPRRVCMIRVKETDNFYWNERAHPMPKPMHSRKIHAQSHVDDFCLGAQVHLEFYWFICSWMRAVRGFVPYISRIEKFHKRASEVQVYFLRLKMMQKNANQFRTDRHAILSWKHFKPKHSLQFIFLKSAYCISHYPHKHAHVSILQTLSTHYSEWFSVMCIMYRFSQLFARKSQNKESCFVSSFRFVVKSMVLSFPSR